MGGNPRHFSRHSALTKLYTLIIPAEEEELSFLHSIISFKKSAKWFSAGNNEIGSVIINLNCLREPEYSNTGTVYEPKLHRTSDRSAQQKNNYENDVSQQDTEQKIQTMKKDLERRLAPLLSYLDREFVNQCVELALRGLLEGRMNDAEAAINKLASEATRLAKKSGYLE
jgi:hypothetical protein